MVLKKEGKMTFEGLVNVHESGDLEPERNREKRKKERPSNECDSRRRAIARILMKRKNQSLAPSKSAHQRRLR